MAKQVKLCLVLTMPQVRKIVKQNLVVKLGSKREKLQILLKLLNLLKFLNLLKLLDFAEIAQFGENT